MKGQKRTRACEACHGLKIKCESLGSEGSWSTCIRCQRLGLNCVPAPPKLQRDRIAELEAQVEALTAAMRKRDDSLAPAKSMAGSVSILGKSECSPRRPETTDGHEVTVRDILTFLDTYISRDDQLRALNAYSHGFKSVWCPASLSTKTLEDVRNESPLLLLSIVAWPMAAEACENSVQRANELSHGATEFLARRVLVEGAQSQELVRALLTAACWHRVPRGEVASHCHQYARLAIDMAIDIGLGGPEFPGSPAVYFRRMDGHEDNDSGRTWLACYAAACMYALNVRRPSIMLWSKQHDASLRIVESSGRFEDRLFCQIILIMSLCEEVAEEFELSNFTAFHDIDHASCQQKIAMLTDRFQKWKVSMPQDLLLHPMMRFWSCIFVVYLHEIVLHTPTNKSTFAAPHVPANLPVADFAAPCIVTSAAATAMSNLIVACHGAILACEEMGPVEILAAPSMIFAPAVMYALKTLVLVFITVNGPGNTFGQSGLVAPNAICMREYVHKVLALSKAVDESTYIDTYWTGRILGAAAWLDTWANDYEVILRRYTEKRQDRDMGRSPD